MGVNKAFVRLGDKPLLQHVIDNIKLQLDGLALNIRGNEDEYQDFSLPLVKDKISLPIGPLGGIYTGLCLAEQEKTDFLHSSGQSSGLSRLKHLSGARFVDKIQCKD